MAVPGREVYWNIPGHQFMYGLLLATLVIFFSGLSRQFSAIQKGKKVQLFSAGLLGSAAVLWREGFAQRRIRRDKLAGLMHLSLFWGFLVLFAGSFIVALQADGGIQVLAGKFYLWFSLVLDIAGCLALLGVAGLAYRRFAVRPPGLSAFSGDGILLVGIGLILLSGFGVEGLRLTATKDAWALWSPAGWLMALAFSALQTNMVTAYRVLWWSHLVLAMAFIGYLPFSKARHILFASVNILWSAGSKTGAVLPLEIKAQVADFGASKTEGFSRKQIVETLSCTQCGRCEQGCPAFLTGKLLSARALNSALQGIFLEAGKREGEVFAPMGTLAPETVWACTTCGYCENECPVFIGHVGRTVEMRRGLVLDKGNVPAELRPVLRNLEKQGNPWGEWRGSRGEWARISGAPLLKEKGKADVLYWVGCLGSFDERSKQISDAMVQILKSAGIDFAILGEEERCCGDAARRSGEDYLFQVLAKRNIAVLEKYGIEKVITGCPHCYHVLKNDYRLLGAEFTVQHTSEFISAMIDKKALKISSNLPASVTYHDPCYLGRYNGIFDEPRQVLRQIEGLQLTETERNREKSFCCGAGGGHLWMEEGEGERINGKRAREVMAAGVEAVVTACPFCVTMLEDGLHTEQAEMKVLDLAEMVARVI